MYEFHVMKSIFNSKFKFKIQEMNQFQIYQWKKYENNLLLL